MKKGMSDVKISLLISIGIIIVLIIVGMIYVWKTTGKNPIKQFVQNVKEVFSLGDNNDSNEFYGGSGDDFGGGGSGGSADSGSSGGSGGNIDKETSSYTGGCIPKQIAHSLTNLEYNTQCREYTGEVCINKLVNCSINIQNLDAEMAGDFEIQLSMVEDGKPKEDAIDTQTFNFYLEPQESQITQGQKEILSIGEDGQANKEIKCIFNTLSVPIKEPCPE